MSHQKSSFRIDLCGRQLLRSAAMLGLLLAAVPAAAQQPVSGTDSSKPDAAPQAPAPSTPAEGFKLGTMEGRSEIEIGYRWVSDIAGNRDMYRSMVNLGEGPKLLHSNLSLRSEYGTGKLFDRLDWSMNSWGGDPYNTMRLNVGRMDLYEFRVDYRNLNYYNFIPTHANPLQAQGRLFGQHSLNVTNRMTDLELKLFPNSRIRPYVGYSRNTGFGPGFTTYGPTANEFLLGTRWNYTADDYRGGVELTLARLNLTLEQGVRFLRNDTSVQFAGDANGNNPIPFIGQKIVMNALDRGYHDRTRIPTTKALLKFAPNSVFRFTGRYLYAMADVESDFSQIEKGEFVSLEELIFYRTAADAYDTRAKSPSHSGGFLVEYSPLSRLTLVDEFTNRNYHISGSALLDTLYLQARSLSGPSAPVMDITANRLHNSYLARDQVRNEATFEYDLGNGLAIRGGHRYTHVEAELVDAESGYVDTRSGSYTQHTAFGGAAFRRGQWLRLMLDYESTDTDQPLMRMGYFVHDRFRFSWRFRPSPKLSASGSVSFLRNSNDQPDIDTRDHNRSYSVAVDYQPLERFSLSLDFSRTNLFSDTLILLPQSFERDRSIFDERSHSLGGALGIDLYKGSRFDFGYRGILSSGSYPLNYHQPFANLTIPLHRNLAWKAYWQYFGYNEKGASIQDYRGHLLTFALALSY